MKIICLVKYVSCDSSKQKQLVINEDDNYALEIALRYKDKNQLTTIEVVTMAPAVVELQTHDLIRKGVDYVTILSDNQFRASDTYATALIIASYLKNVTYDLILSGNETCDGNTGHVGIQVATLLDIDQYSYAKQIDICETELLAEIDYGQVQYQMQVSYPCLISCLKTKTIRPRFVKRTNRKLPVDSKVQVINNQQLAVDATQIGLKGSPTYVKKVSQITLPAKQQIYLSSQDGLDYLLNKLQSEGYIR